LITLQIHHRTIYRYSKPVVLGSHRLMLRPRESRELRLCSMQLDIEPAATLTWAHDVTGNAVALATFAAMSDTLIIDCTATVELHAVIWPVFDIAASAINYPFKYSAEDWTDLGALTRPQYPDPDGRLGVWTASFVRSAPTDTLALLKDINAGVLAFVGYQSRDEEGTQSPVQTLNRGLGSCRDMAVLFIEAVRTLGLGARVVSGYLHNPYQQGPVVPGAGTMHAWAEVFVPGAGWITFDPTNRSFGGANLIPVAVGLDIRRVMPVIGEFVGTNDACIGMSVEVTVSA
jgi:transglutaminase-like putative cysteine protease